MRALAIALAPLLVCIACPKKDAAVDAGAAGVVVAAVAPLSLLELRYVFDGDPANAALQQLPRVDFASCRHKLAAGDPLGCTLFNHGKAADVTAVPLTCADGDALATPTITAQLDALVKAKASAREGITGGDVKNVADVTVGNVPAHLRLLRVKRTPPTDGILREPLDVECEQLALDVNGAITLLDAKTCTSHGESLRGAFAVAGESGVFLQVDLDLNDANGENVYHLTAHDGRVEVARIFADCGGNG